MIKKHEQKGSKALPAEPVPASTPAEPQIKREETRSPAFFSAYTNDVQVQTSPWDMRMIFGEIATPATTQVHRVVINQLGEVRMSPQLAKTVAMIMVKQLRVYESRFGPIPLAKKD